jgi:proteasome lid subunit RPN8/RPN11
MSNPTNRYNQDTRIVKPSATATVQRMSAHESSVFQQYAAAPVIMVESAFQSHEGADERTSGKDRSFAFLMRLAPLVVLWAILGCVTAFVLFGLVEIGEAPSAAIGLIVFVYLSYRSYAGADERERYDSRNGVEHHRIDVAENLTIKKMDHDQQLKRMALEATLRSLEVRGNDY